MNHRKHIRKPLYQRWYVIAPVVIVGLIIVGAVVGGDDEQPAAEPTQTFTTPAQSTPAPEPRETEASSTPAPGTTTDAGLHVVTAQVACENMADELAYPDKIKIHTIVGKQIEQVEADQITFLWDATLVSAAGGELKGEVLCKVSGTDDAPEIDTFEFR